MHTHIINVNIISFRFNSSILTRPVKREKKVTKEEMSCIGAIKKKEQLQVNNYYGTVLFVLN